MLYRFFSTQPAKPAQRETTMSSRLMMGIASAGVLALAAAPFAATPSLAQDRAAVTTEFSAQTEKEQKQQKQQEKVQQREQVHQQKDIRRDVKQQSERQKQFQKQQTRNAIHQQKDL